MLTQSTQICGFASRNGVRNMVRFRGAPGQLVGGRGPGDGQNRFEQIAKEAVDRVMGSNGGRTQFGQDR